MLPYSYKMFTKINMQFVNFFISYMPHTSDPYKRMGTLNYVESKRDNFDFYVLFWSSIVLIKLDSTLL